MQRRIVNPWTWQDAWEYVQANEITSPHRVLICSGQLTTDADASITWRWCFMRPGWA
jgi:hypothetical protein